MRTHTHIHAHTHIHSHMNSYFLAYIYLYMSFNQSHSRLYIFMSLYRYVLFAKSYYLCLSLSLASWATLSSLQSWCAKDKIICLSPFCWSALPAQISSYCCWFSCWSRWGTRNIALVDYWTTCLNTPRHFLCYILSTIRGVSLAVGSLSC